MRRDPDLIRKIAFLIEDADDLVFSASLVIDGYTTEQICYHCELMQDAGLIVVHDAAELNGEICEMIISRLTSKGHDFADAARSDTVWNKTKAAVRDKVGGVALEVLIQILKHQTQAMLGLPPSP